MKRFFIDQHPNNIVYFEEIGSFLKVKSLQIYKNNEILSWDGFGMISENFYIGFYKTPEIKDNEENKHLLKYKHLSNTCGIHIGIIKNKEIKLDYREEKLKTKTFKIIGININKNHGAFYVEWSNASSFDGVINDKDNIITKKVVGYIAGKILNYKKSIIEIIKNIRKDFEIKTKEEMED